ncbi:MAG: HelD family protein, partial [Nocardioidaceae bacterium]
GFSRGSLTAYEDEVLAGGPVSPAAESTGEILRAEIERPRAGPMRDIVATIQPEQDDIVRGDLATSVCVQGAPGTGKTAVGLHRAAYLLYAFRDQLTRQGVLVVGPNASFLRYIGDVLPALGEIDAAQSTVEELTARVPVRGTDSPEAALLKADARMAAVIEAACWAHLQPQSEALVVPRGARRWRIPAYEVGEIVEQLRTRGVRYGTGRAMLAQRIAHCVLVRMEADGDSPDDRVQDTVARSRPVRAYVDAWWPRLEPARVVHRLFGDAAFLEATSAGVLSEPERTLLLSGRPSKSARSARWTEHDAVLIDEAADRIERTPSVGHVVLDEAQDLSEMMLRAVARRSSTGSVTVLGDLAQSTTPWGSRSWTTALNHLGKPDAHVEELTQGFRVPAPVIELAARLLPTIAPGLAVPSSVREGAGSLEVRRCEPVLDLAPAVRRLSGRPGTTGVIVAEHLLTQTIAALDGIAFTVLGEEDDMSAAVDVVPANLAKGLEFDHVVLVEPAAIVDGEPDRVTGLRRLYVCLTRAVTSLVVLHERDLPRELVADSRRD